MTAGLISILDREHFPGQHLNDEHPCLVGLISQDPFSLDGVSRVPKSPSRAYV